MPCASKPLALVSSLARGFKLLGEQRRKKRQRERERQDGAVYNALCITWKNAHDQITVGRFPESHDDQNTSRIIFSGRQIGGPPACPPAPGDAIVTGGSATEARLFDSRRSVDTGHMENPPVPPWWTRADGTMASAPSAVGLTLLDSPPPSFVHGGEWQRVLGVKRQTEKIKKQRSEKLKT